MFQMSFRKVLAVALVLGATQIGAFAQGHPKGNPEQGDDDPSVLVSGGTHAMMKSGEDIHSSANASLINQANIHNLTYYGGPVLKNEKIVKVLYGTTGFQSFLTSTATTGATVAGFLTGVVGSPYYAWLSEYSTTSPAQTIGLGSFSASKTITPAAARNGATITDLQIQAEISAQITSGGLPAPDANTVYSLFFPSGKKITQGGSTSCVQFCAYHGTFVRNGQNVYYTVLPDLSASGCSTGCGTSTLFNNTTSVLSHELIETVTDPAVGIATVYAAPLAWYNKTYGEIGDICNGQQGTVAGTNGTTYTVQKEWSNKSAICKVQ